MEGGDMMMALGYASLVYLVGSGTGVFLLGAAVLVRAVKKRKSG